jgi:penicillin-binding protein 1C
MQPGELHRGRNNVSNNNSIPKNNHNLDHNSNSNSNSNRLRSTLDGPLQRRTREVIEEHRGRLAANHIHNLAALIVDVRTGEVLSYAGNAGYAGNSAVSTTGALNRGY